jgi:hypothetical protein
LAPRLHRLRSSPFTVHSSSHTQPAVVIPCLSTSTLVTVPSLLLQPLLTSRPLRSLLHSLPHLSPAPRGETRNAFRGAHDRPAPNAPCFKSGRRASQRESTAERYPAVTVHLLDTAAPSHPHTRRHRVPTTCRSLYAPRPLRHHRVKDSRGLACVHPPTSRPKVRPASAVNVNVKGSPLTPHSPILLV